ncbi:MAG: AAA family ATPase [Tannerellaceae bacterium]|jgi:exonuclease SbcC|nr:AAA family ATPase [Tannerellaceae bacterium]
MRILAIRGKNLASLEGEFVIDFNREPLKSAGIFVITGSTGSGKSTLLDALCLALFDNMPRTGRVFEHNVQVVDVGDRTLSQRDSRSILRRGSPEGYAEVDFVALGGECFRSRWSVRRSRGRAEGVLQASELRLVNLSAGREEPGRKTELLARITALIGLTFDQFTRTVLLAQGDFAAFLKAGQKEKAELLEKLTGTGIYSRISMAIYARAREAETSLQLLRERIRDVEVLPREEAEALRLEKVALAAGMENLRRETERVTGHLEWLLQESGLRLGLHEAACRLTEAERGVDEARERSAYLARVDGVQEIREVFYERKTTREQERLAKEHLREQELLCRDYVRQWEELVAELRRGEEARRGEEEEETRRKAEIVQARELDVRIAEARQQLGEAEKEYARAGERRRRQEDFVAQTRTSLERARGLWAETSEWFRLRDTYRELIPRMDWALSLLGEATAARVEGAHNRDLVLRVEASLEEERRSLAFLEGEAERLDGLLPAGIASLRRLLAEGSPCPVCGSVHHPYRGRLGGELWAEADLEEARAETAARIGAHSARIEELERERMRRELEAGNCARAEAEALGKLRDFLGAVPDWETSFLGGELQASLRALAAAWERNEAERNRAGQEMVALRAALTTAEGQIPETREALRAQETKRSALRERLEALQARRSALIEGREVGAMEALCLQREREREAVTAERKAREQHLLAAMQSQQGLVSRISREVADASARSQRGEARLSERLEAERGGMTLEELSELLGRDSLWIRSERDFLEGLRMKRTTAEATLGERQRRLAEHGLLESRPPEGISGEILGERLSAMQAAMREQTGRSAAIDLALAGHERGRERLALLQEQLGGETTRAEHWAKLNELFGSADGSKFKVLAQGYTLDVLLTCANFHLRGLSRRYELQRVPGALALQVSDRDMLGEIRSVHSLSGGETFLLSLALALGLSELSSNRMSVESLFIDEGFGSLDADTLRTALDALEGLQSRGRKIGVISHVPELNERIPVGIRILRAANGRSHIEITG